MKLSRLPRYDPWHCLRSRWTICDTDFRLAIGLDINLPGGAIPRIPSYRRRTDSFDSMGTGFGDAVIVAVETPGAFEGLQAAKKNRGKTTAAVRMNSFIELVCLGNFSNM